jgi:ABC-type antimicrobial peptide transport system permease subunit
VVLVNETFVRKFFEDQNPLGKVVSQNWVPNGKPPSLEIVGVVADAVYRSLRDPVPPTMYQAMAQSDEVPTSISISVRAAGGSPAMLTKSLVAAIADVNREVTLTFRPLDDYIRGALVQERMVAMLSGFFGGLALLLAGLGLYGVTSYAVSRRRTEIGIRMALGAAPGGVVRLVLRRVAWLVAIGVVVGGGVSVWAARFVRTLLFGLEPRDPATLVLAAAVLGAVAALAGWLPARRAARLDPAEVLREG